MALGDRMNGILGMINDFRADDPKNAMQMPMSPVNPDLVGTRQMPPAMPVPEMVQTPSLPMAQPAQAPTGQQSPYAGFGDGGVDPKRLELASQAVEHAKRNPEKVGTPEYIDKVKRFFGNEENMVKMAMAFNTMRMNPDQGLAAHLSGRLDTIAASKTANKTAGAVIGQLRGMGEEEAAKIVEANPAMAKEVLKQILQKKYATGASAKTSGVQVDPNTGQQYVVRTLGDGTVERVDIEGATGLTPERKARLESTTRLDEADLRRGQEAAQRIFDKSTQIDTQIGRLESALSALDEGASSGWIQNYLPAMDAATADLRATANQLGIDIINSATFGALSEKELSLALSTGLPTGLPEGELKSYIRDKVAAQRKLRDQLRKDARELSGGMGYNEYIQSRTTPQRETRIPVYDGGLPAGATVIKLEDI